MDPSVEAILAQMNAGEGPKLHELSPVEARAFFDAMQLPAPDLPLASVEDRRLDGPASELPVRIYRPAEPQSEGALVYFHGGGWVIGSIETHDGVCRQLAHDAGCVVVSVDYRLAPESPYPAAAEDCYAALEWVATQSGALGLDPARLAVGGDSAGGNLGAVVAQMARDRGGPKPIFQLLVYPVVASDFETASYRENAEGKLLERDAMRWFWDQYVPEEARRSEPYASPIRADLAGLPPALVITAEFDPLRDEGEAYAAALEAAGVPVTCSRYDGMIHGFFAFGGIVPQAKDALAEASAALRAAFAG